ncbi:MAG: S-methyl-5-thioribose kinase [Geminicoccaceae bacterium]|nr:MAG: S-methyl-5-thioribose kinase [Geminicoccaceae bacterium]
MASTTSNRHTGGPGYTPLTPATLPAWLAKTAGAAARLGGEPRDWRVREVGDGNLNLVFIVEGPGGGLVVKQALPYVRLVGESWPLPLDRSWYEYRALVTHGRFVPELVPALYHFDAEQAAVVMEWLSPHIILRKGLIQGRRYPMVAEHLAAFMARNLFFTSDLGMKAAEKRALQGEFSHNIELCRITEELIFTDPYRIAELNRWTSPQLDDVATAFRADAPLKVAIQELKWGFLSRGQALLHGDLHTGSVMVTEADTRVIDPEFAFVGPMGFDVGAVLANFFLAYFAKAGHPGDEDERAAYEAWLLQTADAVWTSFERRFLALWRAHAQGDAFTGELFLDAAGSAALEAKRQATMRELFTDSVGYAGAKMVRRILGLAHVEDLECIADPDVRAVSERRALAMGRSLIVERQRFDGMAPVLDLARNLRQQVLP